MLFKNKFLLKQLIVVLFCVFTINLHAQTSKELIGKWKLVKWTHNGSQQDLTSLYKTDQIFQIFKDDGKFESVVGEKIHKGRWKLSPANDLLTINSFLASAKFKIELFDSKKRIMSSDNLGTVEYEKVDNQ